MESGPIATNLMTSGEGSDSSTGLMILSPDHFVVFMSDSLKSMLGLKPGKSEGLHCSELFHPDTSDCSKCPIYRALDTRQPVNGIIRINGETDPRDFEFDAVPEFGSYGTPERVIAAVSDVTRIQEAERRLREMDTLYRAIVEDQPAIVYRYKIDGTIVFGNHMLAKYTGRSMQELIGMNMFDLIEPANLERAKRQLARLNPQNLVAIHEHLAHGADGHLAWYQWTDRLILDDEGNPKEYQGVGYDITNRKRIEESERHQRELAEALLRTGEALNSSLDLDEVLSRVLSNVHRMVPHDAAILMMIDDNQKITGMLVGDDQAHRAVNLEVFEGLSAFDFPLLSRMLRGEPQIILDDVKNSSEWKEMSGYEWVRSLLSLPIKSGDLCYGFINLYAHEISQFSETDAEQLHLFANQAAMAIRNARHYENAAWLATHDSLTGLLNRRSFYERALREFHRAARSEGTVSVIMIDLDHFKRVNDTHGHAAGDAVLVHVANLIRSEARESDEVGRYGGEEIVVLLTDTDVAEAELCAERMRLSVQNRATEWGGKLLPLTASFGVAGGFPSSFADTRLEPLDFLIEQADSALYFSKREGRNKVTRWRADLKDEGL